MSDDLEDFIQAQKNKLAQEREQLSQAERSPRTGRPVSVCQGRDYLCIAVVCIDSMKRMVYNLKVVVCIEFFLHYLKMKKITK